MARLLVLRASPDAETTAAEIEARGHQAIVAPLRHAEPVSGASPINPEALVVTSANALRFEESLPESWAGRAIFCVGERSARLIARLGFTDIRPSEDVRTLVAAIKESPLATADLLYLAGEPRRPELEQAFDNLRVWLRYRMVDAPALPPAAKSALLDDRADAICHFSAHSAELWLKLAEAEGLIKQTFRPAHACISPAVGAILHEKAESAGCDCRIIVASRMQGDSVISAALAAVSSAGRPQFD